MSSMDLVLNCLFSMYCCVLVEGTVYINDTEEQKTPGELSASLAKISMDTAFVSPLMLKWTLQYAAAVKLPMYL